MAANDFHLFRDYAHDKSSAGFFTVELACLFGMASPSEVAGYSLAALLAVTGWLLIRNWPTERLLKLTVALLIASCLLMGIRIVQEMFYADGSNSASPSQLSPKMQPQPHTMRHAGFFCAAPLHSCPLQCLTVLSPQGFFDDAHCPPSREREISTVPIPVQPFFDLPQRNLLLLKFCERHLDNASVSSCLPIQVNRLSGQTQFVPKSNHSCPFQFLQCLNEFRAHNPFVMAVIGMRYVIVTIGESAPPMGFTVRRFGKNVMECIADFMRQCAILHIGGGKIWKMKFFGKLESGNGMFRSAAMRPEKRGIRNHVINFIPHREQSGLELFNCRNRGWIAPCVHKSGGGL